MKNMPEKYIYPERYRWYIAQTDKGRKRTYQKSEADARCLLESKGFKIISITKYQEAP